jgi:hypothetical protein
MAATDGHAGVTLEQRLSDGDELDGLDLEVGDAQVEGRADHGALEVALGACGLRLERAALGR